MKFLILFVLFIAGCAYPVKTGFSFEPADKPTRGKALVYLYRPTTERDSLNPDVPKFYLNDKIIGRLSIGGYYKFEVEPGAVEIAQQISFLGIPFGKGQSFEFTADPNGIYFAKYAYEGIPFPTFQFGLVSSAQGKQEVALTSHLVSP